MYVQVCFSISARSSSREGADLMTSNRTSNIVTADITHIAMFKMSSLHRPITVMVNWWCLKRLENRRGSVFDSLQEIRVVTFNMGVRT